MKFGVGLPTCTAGMMYPTPFASAEEVVQLAVEAEQLGYYEVAGNDHITTQQYVRDSYTIPPDFFEPLVTYGSIAAKTSVLHLMTGILVFPLRHPVLLAKQLSTLDQLSNGRVIVGAGVGAYREEFEKALPEFATVNRGRLMEETMEAVRLLFTKHSATYEGGYVSFNDIEMYPKPVQDPLPIYAAGNAEASLRRAVKHGQGWLPAGLSPDAIMTGRSQLANYAKEVGRDGDSLNIAPQVTVCLGDTHEEAEEAFRSSQLFHHMVTLQGSTLKDVSIDNYVHNNLIGDVDEVCAKVERLRTAGAGHLSGMYFVANNPEGLRTQMRRFARDVMPCFPDDS